MTVIADQLEDGVSPRQLLGIDVPRCAASVKLFERISRDDADLHEQCVRVQKALQ